LKQTNVRGNRERESKKKGQERYSLPSTLKKKNAEEKRRGVPMTRICCGTRESKNRREIIDHQSK